MPKMKPSYSVCERSDRANIKQGLTVNIATHIVVTMKVLEALNFVKSNMIGNDFGEIMV